MAILIRYAVVLILFLFTIVFNGIANFSEKYCAIINVMLSIFTAMTAMITIGLFCYTTVEFVVWVCSLTL